jgi:hypothetical protein
MIEHLNEQALQALANVERENGCADHAIIATRETYRKLTA